MTRQDEIDRIDQSVGQYEIIDQYEVGHDQYVTFDVILIQLAKAAHSDTLKISGLRSTAGDC